MNNSSINSLLRVKKNKDNISSFINNSNLHLDDCNSDDNLEKYDIFYVLLNIINFICLLIKIFIYIITNILIFFIKNSKNCDNTKINNNINCNNTKINNNINCNNTKNLNNKIILFDDITKINTEKLINNKAKQLEKKYHYNNKNNLKKNILHDIITNHTSDYHNSKNTLENLFLNSK